MQSWTVARMISSERPHHETKTLSRHCRLRLKGGTEWSGRSGLRRQALRSQTRDHHSQMSRKLPTGSVAALILFHRKGAVSSVSSIEVSGRIAEKVHVRLQRGGTESIIPLETPGGEAVLANVDPVDLD